MKMITFLIVRAVNEMEGDDKDATLPVNVDKASEAEQHEYKKSINKLFPNSSNDKNNEINQDKTPINKKRERAPQAKEDDDGNDDNDSITNREGGRKQLLSITSLQDEKDLAFLGMIQQLQNNMATKERSTTK